MCRNMVTDYDILTLNLQVDSVAVWRRNGVSFSYCNLKLSYLNGSDALRQKPFKDLKGEEFGNVPTNL